MIENFTKRIEEEKIKLEKYNKTFNLISKLRLVTLLAAIILSIYIARISFNPTYVLFNTFLYLIFIIEVILHRNTEEKLTNSKELININNRYISRITGGWENFEDIGEEFIDKAHSYSSDLDIFGKRSLFQLINIANTFHGRKILKKDLTENKFSKEDLLLRQESIKELKENLDFCLKVELSTIRNKKNLKNPLKLIAFAEDNSTIVGSKYIKTFLYILPMFSVVLIAFTLIFKIAFLYNILKLLILLQGMFVLLKLKYINETLYLAHEFKSNLDTYMKILNVLEKESFKSKRLINIKSELFSNDDSALKAVKELKKITDKINLRYNALLAIILDAVLLWDYQCIFSLENWKSQYGSKLKLWINAIGEVESLISFSTLNHIDETLIFPTIDNSNLKVTAKNLGHPLLAKSSRITNDLDMDDKIFVITGSNMSGKTTFLRTIGINLVLAYAGAAVFASEMTCSQMDIFTSMRITDDLQSGISTFYAELIRIKNIIIRGKENNDMIFLIDEIFRGTNSNDRIIGAKNVLSNLNSLGIIGAITTHDLELTALNKYHRIKNYNFSEYYEENKICFDYKLKEGSATTTNAKYLMNLVGIPILEL